MHLIKIWHERLFFLERVRFVPRQANVSINFYVITDENVSWVTDLRGNTFEKQFREMLKQGDFGIYAMSQGMPVGYGWVKRPGSSDYFFDIKDGCRYLCRFFVKEEMRGHGIYPQLISELIQHEKDSDRFYIDVEEGNSASERGLKKVGFADANLYHFFRAIKITFNKKIIK